MVIYMKIEAQDSNVEIFGSNDQHTMQVKNSSKLFTMLIDGLYKDKYGSIVRELSCNAWDAHKSAGKELVPFHIEVPGEIEGKFTIRDFGDGLSKDEIIKYFGTLLESSKENSNDAIGAYGIGCKSPFSIVDDFMVISIKNNIKTSVTFARENKGVPQFFVVGEVKTDEPSGTKIIIDDRDTKKWVYAIQTQLAAFKVKPTTNIDIDYQEITYYGDIGVVHDSNLFQHKTYIDMGQVLYPLEQRDFEEQDIKFIKTNKTIIYKCNIGDINIPPDRERIELTKQTRECIERVVNKQHDDFINIVLEKFKAEFKYNYKWYIDFINRFKSLINNIGEYTSATIPNTYIDPNYLTKFSAKNILHFLVDTSIYYPVDYKKTIQLYTLDSSDIAVAGRYINAKPAAIFESNLPIIFIYDTTIADLGVYMVNNKIKQCILVRMKAKAIPYYMKLIEDISPFYGYNIKPVQLERTKRVKGVSQPRLPKVKDVNLNGIYLYKSESGRYPINEADLDILKSQPCIVLYTKRNGDLTNSWPFRYLAAIQNSVKCPPIFLISERRSQEFNATVNRNILSINDFVCNNIITNKKLVYSSKIKNNTLYDLLYYKFNNHIQPLLKDKAGLSAYLNSIFEKYTDNDAIALDAVLHSLNIKIPAECEDAFKDIKVGKPLVQKLITKKVDR